MNRQQKLQEIRNMEAIAQFLHQSATRFLKECHSARQKLEGVSTPSSARKGEMMQTIAKVVGKRNARIASKIQQQ